MKIVIMLLMVSVVGDAFAWSLFGNYDDCVLDGIKGAQTPGAVELVKKTCRHKYPYPTREKSSGSNEGFYGSDASNCGKAQLSSQEIGKIKLQRDGISYSIWNGNDFIVTDAIFKIFYLYREGQNTEEVIKHVGHLESMRDTPAYNFPSEITSYSIESANKDTCGSAWDRIKHLQGK